MITPPLVVVGIHVAPVFREDLYDFAIASVRDICVIQTVITHGDRKDVLFFRNSGTLRYASSFDGLSAFSVLVLVFCTLPFASACHF